jgi:hypothetical protein
VFFIFVAHLSRPSESEASAIARALGMTEYEVRLALAAPTPTVVTTTASRERAEGHVDLLRARGHGAHFFDDALFVSSQRMPRIDDFRLDADGVRRTNDGELLPYGDVFAILRAVHDTSGGVERSTPPGLVDAFLPIDSSRTSTITKYGDREHVAYFFRRSGEKPWILRERHASYMGLGSERGPIAYGNFLATVHRVREASTMAIYDDRLVRRRVAEKLMADSLLKTSRDGVDLLAHLLAMAIASQAGSPYR